MANIIDGKSIAAEIRQSLKEKVMLLKEKEITPKLSVVLIGEDPASCVYVRNKEKGCVDVGIISDTRRLPANIKESSLIEMIKEINNDDSIHGVLVQVPLPKGLDEKKVLSFISPEKDVDGFHTENVGKLLKGETPLFLPCTPAGIMKMLLSMAQRNLKHHWCMSLTLLTA